MLDTSTIAEGAGITLQNLYDLPRDDEEVLRNFAEDNLTGIFQFEGRATRTIVKRIYRGTDKIPHFMTLADINALSRPGSLISGMTDAYIAAERGDKAKLIHPVVDDVLSATNNCLVYQEQVMQIGQRFGGLDDSEIGRLRKIIGAKQSGGAFDEFWFKFRDGASELHGVDEGKSREVWDYMAASASYLFNVAHAISYALLAYWSMYLKVHYPAEFYASSLASAAKKGKTKGKADPQLLLLQDAIQHGLTVSPPHPAVSDVSWKPNLDRTGVIGGFTQLPGVGEVTARNLIARRDEVGVSAWEENAAASWIDFVGEVSGFGAKSAEKATAFCTAEDPFDIKLTNSAVHTVRKAIHEGDIHLTMPDASSASIPSQVDEDVTYLGHVVSVKVIDVIGEKRQRENLTTEEVTATMKDPELSTKAKIICVDEGGGEVHVNVNRFRYPDLKGQIDDIGDGIHVVHVNGTAANSFGPAIQAEHLTVIELEE